MMHIDESDLLVALAGMGSHHLGLFLQPETLHSPGSLDRSFKLKFKGFFIYAQTSTGCIISLCARDFSVRLLQVENSFESWVSFLPLLCSTKLTCRHFWKLLVFASTGWPPKEGKMLYKVVFIIHIYRLWKGGFGEDDWGCATAAVWQEGCLPSEVFSPNFWDAASDTGPHPINWIAFPQEITGETSMIAADLAGFLCHLHCHVCAPCVWSDGESSGAERDLPKSLLLSFCNDSRNLCVSGFSSRLVIADFMFVIWLSCWLQQKSSLLHKLLARTRCRKLVFHLSLYGCTTFSISSLPAI